MTDIRRKECVLLYKIVAICILSDIKEERYLSSLKRETERERDGWDPEKDKCEDSIYKRETQEYPICTTHPLFATIRNKHQMYV